ncbi:Short-chain dehydrogenase/reductase family protein [Mycena venus]|uniref:Short-chain dehydrogenase/reductase family protein n=1 Tax=Mycena venus TaxID=2733690 RepID=A0A8H6Z219_9AGAR|nr:Short-chain dehydrogenase/reductase family protein [Mycena venus]
MGAILARLFPPEFQPAHMPDLSGKACILDPCVVKCMLNFCSQIAIVTGGNAGCGYHTVKQLLLKNATVYLAARSLDKAFDAINRLKAETGRSAIFLQLDLADLRSVRKAAEEFLAKESKLDFLFNNGGVMISPPEMLTAQNHDLQFGTNVIGHFFLTELLLPALSASHAASQIPARVVHTSSAGYRFAPGRGVEFTSLKGGPERDAWIQNAGSFKGPWKLYGQSKLANILISNHFAKKHSDVLVSCAVHPGAIRTELVRHAALWIRLLEPLYKSPAPMGAYTQLWGATVATPAQMTGQYLIPWGKVGDAGPRAADVKLEEEVVAYIREQVAGY